MDGDEDGTLTPQEKAERDAMLFGMGIYRVHRDGTQEYIPVDETRIIWRNRSSRSPIDNPSG